MELEEIRRRLAAAKPVESSSALTDSLRPEKSATRVGSEVLSPKMNQAVNSGPSPGDSESNQNSAATKVRDREIKRREPTLEQAREVLAISEPLESHAKVIEAVDKVFRPVERFRDHFRRLASLFETVEEASQSTLVAFEKLGDLRDHLVQLAKTFQSVEAFTDQMGKIAENFEPMRPLHEQLARLNDTFCASLSDLARALEPVDMLKVRTAKLFQALDSIGELQVKLNEVAKALRPSKAQEQQDLAS